MTEVRERIGSYVVEGELGRGGMGVVYKARHASLGRQVALKLLLAGEEATLAHERRFQLEAEAVARLQHPNIVRVYEVGADKGRPFYAMELVEGESLKAQLDREGRLEPGNAAGLAATVARALHAAHEADVLHRDIKPANILVTPEGRPLLTDFGLAKDLSETRERLTRTGQLMGTPEFMPPEQADGDLDRIGRPTDVYGLGATLYALLTGRPPFQGTNAINIITKLLRDEPDPPSQHRPGLDRDLETIVLKCLEKEPEDRYLQAAALADDLERYLAGEPIEARPPGRGEGVRRWLRRNRLKAVILLVSLPLALGSVALAVEVLSSLAIQQDPTPQGVNLSKIRSLLAGGSEEAYLLEDLGRIHSLVDRGELEDRIEELDLFLERSPRYFEARVLRGWARLVRGDTAGASVDFAEARQLNGESAEAWGWTARVQEGEGDYEGAVASWSRVAELAPRAPRVLLARARAHSLAGNLSSALADCSLAVELGSSSGAAILCQGVLLARAQDLAGAASLFDRAIEYYPRYALAYAERARLRSTPLEFAQDLGGARLDCSQALKYDPRCALAMAVEVDLELKRDASRSRDAAQAKARQALQLDPRCVVALRVLARLALKRQDAREAMEICQRAIRIDPYELEAYVLSAKALEALGDAEGGRAQYRKALEQEPRYLTASLELSRSYERVGDPRSALRVCDEAAVAYTRQSNVLPPALLFARGRARLATGNLDGAREDLSRVEADESAGIDRKGAGQLLELVRSREGRRKRVQELLSSAKGHLKRREYDAHSSAVEEALDIDSRSAGGYYQRGEGHFYRQKWAAAIADYTRAIEIDPGHFDAISSRGSAHYKSGEYGLAVKDMRAAIAIDGSDVGLHMNLGSALHKLGRFEEAIERFDRALSMPAGEGNPDAYRLRAFCRVMTGDLKGARDDCSRFLELAPASDPDRSMVERLASLLSDGDLAERMLRVEVLFELGRSRASAGDYRAAEKALSKAITLDPDNRVARWERAWVRLHLRENAGTVEDATRVLDLGPGPARRANTHWLRGLGFAQLMRQQDAIEDFQAYLDLMPAGKKAPGVRRSIKLMKAELSPPTSRQFRRRVRELTRSGRDKKNEGRYEDALGSLDRAVSLDPLNGVALLERGLVRIVLGDLKGALADGELAVELRPKHHMAHVCLARSLHRLGRHKEAIPPYSRAMELGPNPHWILLERSECYDAMGETAEALAGYRTFLKLVPKEPKVREVRRRVRELEGADR